METPLVSVIIPVYNVKQYLEKCINSIINQTYKNLEIILVDDGSTDGSSEICDSFCKIDQRVKVIHKINGGLSSARNAGLDNCSGDYIGFVDSDDYIDIDMYESLLKVMNDTDVISCCGVYRESTDGETTLSGMTENHTIYSEEEALFQVLSSGGIEMAVWCKLFEKKAFDNIRFPLGETNEDAAILIDLFKGKKIIHIGEPKYHYIVRNNSITSTMSLHNLECALKNAKSISSRVENEYPSITIQGYIYLADMSRFVVYMCIKKKEYGALYHKAYNVFSQMFLVLLKQYRFKPKRLIQCYYLRLHHIVTKKGLKG